MASSDALEDEVSLTIDEQIVATQESIMMWATHLMVSVSAQIVMLVIAFLAAYTGKLPEFYPVLVVWIFLFPASFVAARILIKRCLEHAQLIAEKISPK